VFEQVLAAFAKKAPAALLFRGLFARTFNTDRINDIFREHKQRQVEGNLVFSKLVDLITPVVLGRLRSVRAAHRAYEQEIGVSHQAVYDKLQGVECSVSEALVRVSATDLEDILQISRAHDSDPVPGYHTFIIDGKRLDGTEHRIEETRGISNAPLPGTVLALLDTRSRMFVDIACSPDGHACERKVVAPLLARLQKGCLYLADRNFCDGPTIAAFHQVGAYFLVRQHQRSPVWRPLPNQRVKKRKGKQGLKVSEQDVEVRLPDGTWLAVRRLTIHLSKPTRNGDRVVHLLTNLPPSVPACTVGAAYRGRWTIESCLGHLAQALNAEINTLAYPKAALLCFSLALVAYNIIRALSLLLTKHNRAKDPPKLSNYYLATEIVDAQGGLDIMTTCDDWEQLAQRPLHDFCAWIKSVAQQATLSKYRVTSRGPKRPTRKRKQLNRTTHVSTYKLIRHRRP
jgi:hypothetical protein